MNETVNGLDETTHDIIEKITVRFERPTQIRSGHVCMVYYDCMQLAPSDLARLAAQTTGHVGEHAFDMTIGIAYYGIFFAAAIAGGKQVSILGKDNKFYGPDLKGKRVLIVDDVVHSGRAIREAASLAQAAGAEVVGYACVVDRSGGALKLDKPLWSSCQTIME